jgi:hypothetical protein
MASAEECNVVNRRAFLGGAAASVVVPLGVGEMGASAERKASPPALRIVGDWQVAVEAGTWSVGRKRVTVAAATTLDIAPATLIRARDEKFDTLPPYDEKAAPWARGARLRQLVTFETSAADMLVPGSLVLKSGPGDSPRYAAGRDYRVEPQWATVGRLTGGIPAEAPVWADYDCGWNRIDSVVADGHGAAMLREGAPHNATPHPPAVKRGETVIANIWVPGRLSRLALDNLYPIIEPEYRDPARTGAPAAKTLLPKTWARLESGKPVHILAWGDSVTAGGQASDAAHQYQSRFVELLHSRFPRAALQLTTAAWGGRNSDSFLNEPPGAEFNFERAVLAPRPDLVVMEFVNDAWMTPDVVEQKYAYLQKRLQEVRAEWIILTPHFVRPDWMGAASARVEMDPRPYVAGLRKFAAAHHVALADASLRWGHLVREGIPYTTLLCNSINHPDDRGHEMFAQALMDLFR